MHGQQAQFVLHAAVPLAWLYGIASAANAGTAAWWWRKGRSRRAPARALAVAWLVVSALFAVAAFFSWRGSPPAMSEGAKNAIDSLLSPTTLTLAALAALAWVYAARRFFARAEVAWAAVNLSVVFLGLSLTDRDFASVVAKPDNIAIVGMVYLLAFFLWLATANAVVNDARRALGQGPVEKDYSDTALVWPDLVYIELISMLILSTLLILWSIGVPAPLEQPANPAITPNPSKAPWYFVGLQEMLVFFDASMAGVVFPLLIIIGLAAIPYLDVNRQSSGYYTIDERKFACAVFLFGFLGLWVLLILIGTFMRGPNWSFFALYETRDPHKMVLEENIRLSQYVWSGLLHRPLPSVPVDGTWARLGAVLLREAVGIALLAGYFVALPSVLARTAFRQYRQDMGRGRYLLMTFLLLMMLTLPLKMMLRWSFHLSYLISMPEYYFNF